MRARSIAGVPGTLRRACAVDGDQGAAPPSAASTTVRATASRADAERAVGGRATAAAVKPAFGAPGDGAWSPLAGALAGTFGRGVAGVMLAATGLLGGCATQGGPGLPLDEASDATTSPADVPTFDGNSCASKLFQQIVHDAFRRGGRDLVPRSVAVTYHNAVGRAVYIEPKAIYEAASALIARARHEILIQTFAFDIDSDPTRRIFIALKERALEHAKHTPNAPPIITRILVDTMPTGMNGNSTTGALMRQLARKIELMGFDPADMRFELVAFEHTWLGSSHAKLVGIDRQTFLITGSNFGPDNGFEDGEHDAGFLVEGDVARALEATHAALRTLPGAQTYACGSGTLIPGRGGDAEECLAPPAPMPELPEAPAASATTAACSPIAVFAKPPDDHFLATGEPYALDDALLGAFAHAKGEIDLASPNLNAADLKEAILSAVERGETVKLILSKNYEDRSEWVPGQGGVNSTTVDELYDALASAGLSQKERCERLQIRWYSHDGEVPIIGNSPHASHVKLYAFRGQGGDLVVFVGSLNLDTQSWKRSSEVLVAIDDDAAARAWLEQLFEPAFARSLVVDQCLPAP